MPTFRLVSEQYSDLVPVENKMLQLPLYLCKRSRLGSQ